MSDRARLRIAFQGELGSFSDEAIQQLYGGEVQRLPYRDFADVTTSAASGIADRGVLPIENTMAGSIAGAHDAISAMEGLHVVAETVVAVHHCLLGPPSTTFEQVTSVLCHPVALAQCRQFFAENPQLEVHPSYDTAGAAMDVSKIADPAFAAVASRRAAPRSTTTSRCYVPTSRTVRTTRRGSSPCRARRCPCPMALPRAPWSW